MNTATTSNRTILRSIFFLAVAALIGFGNMPKAEAAGVASSVQPFVHGKWTWPIKAKDGKKFEAKKWVPKVKFKASGKLNKTTARVQMYALVTFAGKSKKISIFNMGIKKKGKSVKVHRKIGKLRVALTVSWTGKRSITIKGTARYMKFKVPVPKITIRV
ncbi:MAG: hypothetical protein QNJ90_00145 [Planctomycetota bacterium]|nr:hypothetical protein [Planctomycetota bacterium]